MVQGAGAVVLGAGAVVQGPAGLVARAPAGLVAQAPAGLVARAPAGVVCSSPAGQEFPRSPPPPGLSSSAPQEHRPTLTTVPARTKGPVLQFELKKWFN